MPAPFSYQRSPTDPARLQAVINANTIGVDKTNEGNRALKEGQHDKALRLHQEALNLKIQGYGLLSLQAAVSWNALGETYLAMGGVENLKKAAELLERVLWTRVDKVLGGRKLGVALADAPRDNMALKLDAAVSRENLARVLEAQFKVAAAGTLRRTGDDFVGGVVCGNDEVSLFMPFSRKEQSADHATFCAVHHPPQRDPPPDQRASGMLWMYGRLLLRLQLQDEGLDQTLSLLRSKPRWRRWVGWVMAVMKDRSTEYIYWVCWEGKCTSDI